MAWVKRSDRMVPGASSVAVAQTQLARIADIVVDASSNWSYSQYVYDTTKTALVLTHKFITSPAALCGRNGSLGS